MKVIIHFYLLFAINKIHLISITELFNYFNELLMYVEENKTH